MTRSEAYKKISDAGGRTSNSVSPKTNYLIAGENPGSKLEMAKKGWDRKSRPRIDTHPLQRKLKWEISDA